jgi:2,3-bisphosphoglycerate-independent phosphoglycerate mutase
MSVKPTLLLILDGWGMAPAGPGNAISQARTPTIDGLWTTYPNVPLACSGRAVGLPEGQMGNSEVGHMNIGAGRVVYQDIMRINMAIEDGSLYDNPTLLEMIHQVKARGGTMHFAGLISPGGVHSLQTHLYALLRLCARQKVDAVVHAILDGRDTPPQSGLEYVRELQGFMDAEGVGRIATVSGRYYAMDRDKRWERTALAYAALVSGEGVFETDALQAIATAYAQGENDEFVRPRVITDSGNPVATLRDGDGFMFFNFRADRARQLIRALIDPDFSGFERVERPEPASLVTMTQYEAEFGLPVAFPPVRLTRILGELVAEAGLAQLRIAETEKYAHITYFFNGGEERQYPGEERILIPSPREVATYDKKPEMSVFEVTDKLCEAIRSRRFALIVCNFANLDMVGHTGIIEAAVHAAEAVDRCLARVIECILESDSRMFVTSDHGNAEEMIDPGGGVQTAHSTNKVPFFRVEKDDSGRRFRSEGVLGDIAPTILELWSMDKPQEMTGTSLLEKESRP